MKYSWIICTFGRDVFLFYFGGRCTKANGTWLGLHWLSIWTQSFWFKSKKAANFSSVFIQSCDRSNTVQYSLVSSVQETPFRVCYRYLRQQWKEYIVNWTNVATWSSDLYINKHYVASTMAVANETFGMCSLLMEGELQGVPGQARRWTEIKSKHVRVVASIPVYDGECWLLRLISNLPAYIWFWWTMVIQSCKMVSSDTPSHATSIWVCFGIQIAVNHVLCMCSPKSLQISFFFTLDIFKWSPSKMSHLCYHHFETAVSISWFVHHVHSDADGALTGRAAWDLIPLL